MRGVHDNRARPRGFVEAPLGAKPLSLNIKAVMTVPHLTLKFLPPATASIRW
jgi:hypothetical protein